MPLLRLLPVAALLLLAGCGFHLRQSAVVPPAMQDLHLAVSGSGELAEALERELVLAGVQLHQAAGPGVAELVVRAAFDSQALTVSGYARVQEFSVVFRAEASVMSADGSLLLEPALIEMQREFTYDRSEALGTATREEQVRASLVKDMAQAIVRRLQAVGETPPGA